MNLLCLKDFKDFEFDSNWSRFDYLLEVTKIDQEKLKKKSLEVKQVEEKKTQGFVFKLKYFRNNALKLESLIKKEATNFKLGKLNKNVGLRSKFKSNEEEEGGLKLKRSKIGIPSYPNPPPDLPENFKKHIVSNMGGSDWLLVIQKPIFFSDVNPGASRFSIPFSQIRGHEFLYKKEAEDLKDKKDMQVRLLEPSLEETTLNFWRWNMVKSSMYVLTTMWNSVVRNNQLEIDDVVQLWSFRVESRLCFALVKVDDVQKGSEEWVRHSKSNENGASSSHQEEGHGGCRRISC
ncbi:PREDICTED: B3 domain-containing protein At5g24050 [Theobroma cacao]|uniref:B3 domain-containing protein At5g24050 n=1 Tax=Theobroma cacao TaxID=3641 RepID=A0AB32VFB2_THECC|nr:PREDICTED: B3 domain-containing protein At5g24050 [Theobroma cacao]